MSTEQASNAWNNVSAAYDKDSQSNTSAIKPLHSMVIVKFLRYLVFKKISNMYEVTSSFVKSTFETLSYILSLSKRRF
jgi:hypothetical protein